MKKVKKQKPLVFDAKQLSADIFAKRQKEDLSFGAITRATGLSKAYMFQIEGLQKTDIRVSFLAKICDWLGTNPNAYFVRK